MDERHDTHPGSGNKDLTREGRGTIACVERGAKGIETVEWEGG